MNSKRLWRIDRLESPPQGQIFEDFVNGSASDATIGLYNWYNLSSGGGSGVNYSLGTNSADVKMFGARANTTAASNNAYCGHFLACYPNSVVFGLSIQACFAVPVATACTYSVEFGSNSLITNSVRAMLDFGNSKLTFYAMGASTDVATGLTLAVGDFKSGTRYRLYMRAISASATEIILASAPWNSTTWTKVNIGLNGSSDVFTHASYAPAWIMTDPRFHVSTQAAVAKTAYTDWVMVNSTQAR